MAAAFARALAPAGTVILSGGTSPAGAVNPTVVAVMKERGIDISGARPHQLTFDEAMSADYFVTMGCSEDEACPAGFRGDVRDWALEDPKGKPIEAVRALRDDIERRVRALLEEAAARAPSRPVSGKGRP
jgi:arsenate reductase